MNKLIINKLRDAAHRWAVDQSREGVHICTVGSDYFLQLREDKFVELLIKECIMVVKSVQPGYRDYRSQIEEAMQDDCVEVIEYYFEIKE